MRQSTITRRTLRSFSVGLAVITTVLAFGCSGDDERPPAPPIGQTSSGGGGSGGESPAGPGPANLCECAAQEFTFATSACAECINELAVPAARCGQAAAACTEDSDCLALIQILDDCSGDPACISDALVTKPGHDKYVAILACACNECGPKCRYAKSLTCDVKPPVTTSGVGGSGGG